MIGYLEGKILASEPRRVLVKVAGVGYWVMVSEKLRDSLAGDSSDIEIFTFEVSNPRDGSRSLFGFKNLGELQFFDLLTSVNGVGPKSAQAILDGSDVVTLATAITNENLEVLSGLSGVGPKTAKRLITELKSKIEKMPILLADDGEISKDAQVVEALVSLGYSGFEAREALRGIARDLPLERRISEALKIMSR